MFKLSATRVLEKFDSMEDGESLDYIFIPRLYNEYTYLRYNIGICYSYNSGGEGLDHILLPTFGIEAGLINKFFAILIILMKIFIHIGIMESLTNLIALLRN